MAPQQGHRVGRPHVAAWADTAAILAQPLQQPDDLLVLAVELAILRTTSAGRPAKLDTLSLLPGEGFLGPLADEVALDLRGHAERYGDELGARVVAERPALLDRDEDDSAGQARLQDAGDGQHVPGQPPDLADDESGNVREYRRLLPAVLPSR